MLNSALTVDGLQMISGHGIASRNITKQSSISITYSWSIQSGSDQRFYFRYGRFRKWLV